MTTATKYKTYPKYKPSDIDWLGNIPEGWEVKRLKYITQFKYGEALKDEDRISDGDFEVYGSNGIIGNHNLAITKNKTIVVGRKGSYGKITWVKQSCFPVDTTFYIDETATSNNLRWIYYLLLCIKLDEGSQDSAVPGLSREKAYNIFTPFLPIKAQQIIADFLDCETTKIDEMVAKKQKLIELLKEKRQVFITHAVTCGLDENGRLRQKPKCLPASGWKPSGIDWLGDIPVGWEILPFTKYLEEKSDYRGATPEKVDNGIFLVTARNVRMGYIDYETSQEYVRESEYKQIMSRGLPKVGDILFTTEAPLGNIALVDKEDIALAQRIIRFRMIRNIFSGKFTFYAMMAKFFQNQLASLSTGSTAEGLKASKLNFLWLIHPSINQQKEIVDFLDRETAKIDEVVAKVGSQIEKLQEYRQALISNVVTGKVRVVQTTRKNLENVVQYNHGN